VGFRRLWKIAKSDYELRHVCLCVCLSVCQYGTTRLLLGGFFFNLMFEYFSKNMSRKFNFYCNMTRIKGILHNTLSTNRKIAGSIPSGDIGIFY